MQKSTIFVKDDTVHINILKGVPKYLNGKTIFIKENLISKK